MEIDEKVLVILHLVIGEHADADQLGVDTRRERDRACGDLIVRTPRRVPVPRRVLAGDRSIPCRLIPVPFPAQSDVYGCCRCSPGWRRHLLGTGVREAGRFISPCGRTQRARLHLGGASAG